ncbi:hypothetical protein DSO57_1003976 [Entomophthora muscae]|uniref:Uncharacterized protein n=1 Tax=Entomophthora muscae TaxID=34485 RepID=A0ACC2TW35_9FUNG|nr:hypothetical protein DSO57_1003976 [Entomophthora muscae]
MKKQVGRIQSCKVRYRKKTLDLKFSNILDFGLVMSSSENNPHITITHAYMTKSNLQEIVYDGKHPEMIQIGENEPEDNNPEKHKPADKQEISLQEEVGILLDDIEISSLLAFKTAKEVVVNICYFGSDFLLAP